VTRPTLQSLGFAEAKEHFFTRVGDGDGDDSKSRVGGFAVAEHGEWLGEVGGCFEGVASCGDGPVELDGALDVGDRNGRGNFDRNEVGLGACAGRLRSSGSGLVCGDDGWCWRNDFDDAIHGQADGVAGAVVPVVPFIGLAVIGVEDGGVVFAGADVVRFTGCPGGVGDGFAAAPGEVGFAVAIAQTDPKKALGGVIVAEGLKDPIFLGLVANRGEMTTEGDGFVFGVHPVGGFEEDVNVAVGGVGDAIAERLGRGELNESEGKQKEKFCVPR
jgi:hypothetical protein